jgi:hypothetical protein
VVNRQVSPYYPARSTGEKVEAMGWAIILWLAPQRVGGMVLVLNFQPDASRRVLLGFTAFE